MIATKLLFRNLRIRIAGVQKERLLLLSLYVYFLIPPKFQLQCGKQSIKLGYVSIIWSLTRTRTKIGSKKPQSGKVKVQFWPVWQKNFPLNLQSLISPHLNLSNIVFLPSLQRNQNTLTHIQRWATKLVRELKFKPCKQHLKPLNLYASQYRHLIGDLLIFYNTMNTPEHPHKYPPMLTSNINLKGNTQTLETHQSRTDWVHTSYSLKVVIFYSSLLVDLVRLTSHESYKHKTWHFLKDSGEHFNEIYQCFHFYNKMFPDSYLG